MTHERSRPKASAPPTAEQARYHAWLRERGFCEACGIGHRLVIHHILARAPGKVGRRDHWFVVLICAGDHNERADSVHGLGSEAAFAEKFRIDLVAISVARLMEYRNERDRAG